MIFLHLFYYSQKNWVSLNSLNLFFLYFCLIKKMKVFEFLMHFYRLFWFDTWSWEHMFANMRVRYWALFWIVRIIWFVLLSGANSLTWRRLNKRYGIWLYILLFAFRWFASIWLLLSLRTYTALLFYHHWDLLYSIFQDKSTVLES